MFLPSSEPSPAAEEAEGSGGGLHEKPAESQKTPSTTIPSSDTTTVPTSKNARAVIPSIHEVPDYVPSARKTRRREQPGSRDQRNFFTSQRYARSDVYLGGRSPQNSKLAQNRAVYSGRWASKMPTPTLLSSSAQSGPSTTGGAHGGEDNRKKSRTFQPPFRRALSTYISAFTGLWPPENNTVAGRHPVSPGAPISDAAQATTSSLQRKLGETTAASAEDPQPEGGAQALSSSASQEKKKKRSLSSRFWKIMRGVAKGRKD
ncbi:hypothetical protein PsYK624_063130 [Phanerochaete sordida]|uniref:Uncharacterized protein n=1 Tax=Phanerochaete sordida TaxID=48140 RepID=A0A9P3G6I7_9APHY|nr:hypothetical protein PsYK624_063130 [Phanerochaete sordida]